MPKKLKKLAVKGLVPLAILVLAIVGFVGLVAMNEGPERRAPQEAAMLVETIRPAMADDRFVVEAQGTVRPRTETTIVPEVSGRIEWLSEDFAAGGVFEAGDVLARIDPSDYEAALLAAEAELASARAALADEEARSEASREDFRRLYGPDREPPDLVARLPQLAGARARVQAQEAAVMRAKRDLERTRIRLPYDGMVRRRSADLGQYVTAGSNLGEAFAVDRAEVRLPLSDRDLAFLDLPETAVDENFGRPVRLYATVSGRRGEWPATLVRTEGVVDADTRLTYLVAEVVDPYALDDEGFSRPLPMGTYVEALIPGRSADGLVVLPVEALHGVDQVYVADAEDRLDVRTVDVVRQTVERVYIDNNLSSDDRVITTAIPAPLPGMKLRVRETEPEQQLRLLPPDEELATTAAEEA
ncbi:MAG: efflux RND transporter periplasmic adaptor subunit [Wenzhouxiangellaceae bacterium]|nr:efflux RND transporter periplasmic adaptor subunit [Wenzhouxiangellaceae bacterium]